MNKLITFLALSLASVSLSFAVFAADEQTCKVDTEKLLWTKADYAITGDTLVINRQRVRLAGLYAPQLEKKQKWHTPGEPLAKEAQTFLNKLLANNDLEVGIEFDTTRLDNRNRQLVHLFLRDGTSVQQKMLESGYTLARTTYNNLKHAECYYQAEQKARNGQYQLWDFMAKNPDRHFPLANSSKLTSEDEGFRIIKGKIVKVEKSSSNYILNMDTTGIRVQKKYWKNFDYNQLKALNGKTIEVRGYAYLYKGAMYMMLDHPYSIDALNPTAKASK